MDEVSFNMVCAISSGGFENFININSISQDTSSLGLDSILQEQNNTFEQILKQNTDTQDIKPIETKTWEDRVADEILQISIENNLSESLNLQISQKEAQKAYCQK